MISETVILALNIIILKNLIGHIVNIVLLQHVLCIVLPCLYMRLSQLLFSGNANTGTRILKLIVTRLYEAVVFAVNCLR